MDPNNVLPYISLNTRLNPEDLLPCEIWSLIFSFITKPKDIDNLLKTCHLFNNLIYDEIKCIGNKSTCFNKDKFNINVVKKFKSLRRIKINFPISTQSDLEYLNKLKLKEVRFTTNFLELVLQFILDNPQLDSCNINGELVRNSFILENKILYILNLNDLVIETLLNILTNPNIISICPTYGLEFINKLIPYKYKLRLSFLDEDEIHFIKTPFTIELVDNIIQKFVTPCLIKHKIFCKYDCSKLDQFEIFLETIKYNFPNSDLSEVIYDKTSYLKYYLYRRNNTIIKCYRLKDIDISNKSYKII